MNHFCLYEHTKIFILFAERSQFGIEYYHYHTRKKSIQTLMIHSKFRPFNKEHVETYNIFCLYEHKIFFYIIRWKASIWTIRYFYCTIDRYSQTFFVLFIKKDVILTINQHFSAIIMNHDHLPLKTLILTSIMIYVTEILKYIIMQWPIEYYFGRIPFSNFIQLLYKG